MLSDPDPLDLVQSHLVSPPVVEPRGLGRLVGRHLAGVLHVAAVQQIGGDRGGAEGVAAAGRFGQAGGLRAPLDHLEHVGAVYPGSGELLPGVDRLEQGRLGLAPKAGGIQSVLDVVDGVVVRRRHLLQTLLKGAIPQSVRVRDLERTPHHINRYGLGQGDLCGCHAQLPTHAVDTPHLVA